MTSLAELQREFEAANDERKAALDRYREARERGTTTAAGATRIVEAWRAWRQSEERTNAARIRMLDARAAIGRLA